MKMILADDEAIITRGLQKLMDWPALGIDIVGVYEDGKAAFDGIVRHRPDLALLDISMPGMTGIDILKECGGMRLKTQIVFISGFQDFAYAKEAVKWGGGGLPFEAGNSGGAAVRAGKMLSETGPPGDRQPVRINGAGGN